MNIDERRAAEGYPPITAFDSPKWPCPGEQAVSDDIYYPAALRLAQQQADFHQSRSRAYAFSFFDERRSRRVYQVLALLGWAAVVVMGVWG